MKITHKLVLAGAMCLGFTSSIVPAKVKVQIYKTDPATFKDTWSYQVDTKKDQTSPISHGPIKPFKKFTSAITIDTSNLGATIRVFKSKTDDLSKGTILITRGMINEIEQNSNMVIALNYDRQEASAQNKENVLIDIDYRSTMGIKLTNKAKEDVVMQIYSMGMGAYTGAYDGDRLARGKSKDKFKVPSDKDFKLEVTLEKKGQSPTTNTFVIKKSELKKLKSSGLNLDDNGNRIK